MDSKYSPIKKVSQPSGREEEKNRAINAVVQEIRRMFTVKEMKEIASKLMSHGMMEEPPELVKRYAEIIAIKQRKGNGKWDVTDRQAWMMVRDEYFKEIEEGK